MSDSCPKCYDSKKDCRCTLCTVCEADIGPESNQLKIIFKRKKMFCRKCSIPLCGKCLVNTLCSNCNNVQEAYNDLWHEIDIALELSPKEKDIDNAFEDMIDAIKDGSLSTLQNLLDHCGKTFLEKFDSEGQTLLHHAVRAADVESLQYLLDCGANVNCLDNEGCSPLHLLAAGQRTPRQGQLCDLLVSSGINTFFLNKQHETALAISLQTDNFELQSFLEPIMFRDSSNIIVRYLTPKPELPDDVYACLRYIVSKLKCLNPFEKKQTSKVAKNKSMNYRSLKDKGPLISEGCDPYKLKKTVADNNDKITKLKEEITHLRDELVQNSEIHRADIERLEDSLLEEKEMRTTSSVQLQEYHHNTVSIIEEDLKEAKKLEEDAIQALSDALKLNKKYKLCWVPKSVTRKCADTSCAKIFRDGYSAHHCRCCGRVFCYQCSINRLKVPEYGYDQPVRVCNYCHNLLNEEVLCDFDETDLDIDQWNSVHYQNASNTDNMGKKSIFKFQRSRSTTYTSATSGYVSKSVEDSSIEVGGDGMWSETSSVFSAVSNSPTDSEVLSTITSDMPGGMSDMPGGMSNSMPEGLNKKSRSCSGVGYSDDSSAIYSDSESTLSNNSVGSVEELGERMMKTANSSTSQSQWKNFQRMLSLKNSQTFKRRGSSKV